MKKTFSIVLMFLLCAQFLQSCAVAFPVFRPEGVWESEDGTVRVDFSEGQESVTIALEDETLEYSGIVFKVVEECFTVGKTSTIEETEEDGPTIRMEHELEFEYKSKNGKLELEVIYSAFGRKVEEGTKYVLTQIDVEESTDSEGT